MLPRSQIEQLERAAAAEQLGLEPQLRQRERRMWQEVRLPLNQRDLIKQQVYGEMDLAKAERLSKATKEDLKREAKESAIAELPGASIEELNKRATRIYRQLKRNQEVAVRRAQQRGKGRLKGIQEAKKAGAGITEGGSYLSPEQWSALLKGDPFAMSREQIAQKRTLEGEVTEQGDIPLENVRQAISQAAAMTEPLPTAERMRQELEKGEFRYVARPSEQHGLQATAGRIPGGAEVDPSEALRTGPLAKVGGGVLKVMMYLNALERGALGGVAGVLKKAVTETGLPEKPSLEEAKSMVEGDKTRIGPGVILNPFTFEEEFKGAKPRAFYGVPLDKIEKVTGVDPGELVSEAASRAWGAASSGDPQSIHDLSFFLKGIKDHYKQQAKQLAIEEFENDPEVHRDLIAAREEGGPDALKAALSNRAKKFYEALVERDAGPLLDSPHLAQLAGEMAAGGVIGGAYAAPFRAGKKILQSKPVARALEPVERAVKGSPAAKLTRYIPEKAEFEIAAKTRRGLVEGSGERAREMVHLMEAAPAVGERGSRALLHDATKLLRKLEGGSRKDKLLFWQAANAIGPFEGLTKAQIRKSLPKHLKPKYDAHVKLARLHGEARIASGLGQRWEKGVLRGAKETELEHFVPFRITKKGVRSGPEDLRSLTKVDPRLVAKSSLKRKGANPNAPIPDVYKQWREELRQFAPLHERALELKTLEKYAKGKKFKYVEEWSAKTFKGKEGRKLLKARVLEKEIETGVPHRAIGAGAGTADDSKKYGEVWSRLMGDPGIKKGTKTYIVAEPLAARLAALVPKLEGVAISDRNLPKMLESFAAKYKRPAERIGKYLVTIPNPGFIARNTAGSFGLSYLAHGFRGISPDYVASSGLLIRAAMSGDNFAREIPFTLRSGKEVTLGQVADAFDKVGIFNQLEHKVAMEALQTGAIDKAGQFVETAARTVGLDQLARFSEDFQHAIVGLNFLDDLSDEGIAKMLHYQAKFGADYRRLSDAERFISRDFVWFYAWQRFVAGMFVRNLVDNPKRMGDFVRLRKYMEGETGAVAPFGQEALPPWMTTGITGPESVQPPTVREALDNWRTEDGDLPRPGSEAYTMMVMEDPIMMSAPVIEAMFGGNIPNQVADRPLYQGLGPVWQYIVEELHGTDAYGNKITDPWNHGLETLSQMARPYKTWENVYDVFTEAGAHDQATEWKMRNKMVRDLGQLGLVLDKMAPGDPVFNLNNIKTWMMQPWLQPYLIEPSKELGRKQRSGMELIRPYMSQEIE